MGRLYVVGIGPGDRDHMTEEALRILSEADRIIGYTTYLNLIRDLFPGRPMEGTGMRQEKERCALALKYASEGENVAVVSSGDAGIYGMAGLCLEMAEAFPDVEVTVIPGISAALSGAALLGAPLDHDFVVLSLSDLLTPREIIEKRLRYAAEGDFAICLYNPGSLHRPDGLRRACDLLLEILPADRLCGIVRCIARPGQESRILTLGDLRGVKPDMLMTVWIGSSRTRVVRNRLVTPRGYTL